jgi:hypothetical protein
MGDSFNDLNNENFLLYAIKAYDKPNCVMSEFEEDLKRFDYLKRLIYRYREYNDLQERLMINHIIILSNVFGPDCVVRMLFYRLDENSYPIIKTILVFLNIMPDVIKGVKGKHIYSSDISLDNNLVQILRNVK